MDHYSYFYITALLKMLGYVCLAGPMRSVLCCREIEQALGRDSVHAKCLGEKSFKPQPGDGLQQQTGAKLRPQNGHKSQDLERLAFGT